MLQPANTADNINTVRIFWNMVCLLYRKWDQLKAAPDLTAFEQNNNIVNLTNTAKMPPFSRQTAA